MADPDPVTQLCTSPQVVLWSESVASPDLITGLCNAVTVELATRCGRSGWFGEDTDTAWTDVADVPADLNQYAIELVSLRLNRRKRADTRSITSQVDQLTTTYDTQAEESIIQKVISLYWTPSFA